MCPKVVIATLGEHTRWIQFFKNCSQEHFHQKCGIHENSVSCEKCSYPTRAHEFTNMNLDQLLSDCMIGDYLLQFLYMAYTFMFNSLFISIACTIEHVIQTFVKLSFHINDLNKRNP